MRLVTERADQGAIRQLAEVLERMGKAVQMDQADVFGELDLAFHRTIWQASANPLLVRIAELVEGQIRLLVATGARAPGRMPVAFAEHKRVFNAIAGQQTEDAQAAMLEHIKNSKDTLKRAMPTTLRSPAFAEAQGAPPKATKLRSRRKPGGAPVASK